MVGHHGTRANGALGTICVWFGVEEKPDNWKKKGRDDTRESIYGSRLIEKLGGEKETILFWWYSSLFDSLDYVNDHAFGVSMSGYILMYKLFSKLLCRV